MPQAETLAKFRITVFYKKDDPRGTSVKEKFINLGFPVNKVYITDNYLLDIDLNEDQIRTAVETHTTGYLELRHWY